MFQQNDDAKLIQEDDLSTDRNINSTDNEEDFTNIVTLALGGNHICYIKKIIEIQKS